MEPDTAHSSYHFISILLQGDTYEAELNEQIFGALRQSPAASGITTPAILLGPANLAYFIDRFLSELLHLPLAIEITTPEQELRRQVDGFEEGRPDPANPGATWRALSLDLRMELGSKREARVFIRELPSEELIQISFAFAQANREDSSPGQMNDLRWFREFLFALTGAYPVQAGTIGLDLVAVDALFPAGDSWLENRFSLEKIVQVVCQGKQGLNFDFVFISPAIAGGDKPFVYNRIEPIYSSQEIEAGGRFHDLRLAKELHEYADQAENAYDRMYESSYPKDDRDDALSQLSKAIGLAGSLGLANIAADLKGRYEHINAVFNSQFRR